jgi:hypothetical protein
MKFRGGEFSTGTTGNFQPELTNCAQLLAELPSEGGSQGRLSGSSTFRIEDAQLAPSEKSFNKECGWKDSDRGGSARTQGTTNLSRRFSREQRENRTGVHGSS